MNKIHALLSLMLLLSFVTRCSCEGTERNRGKISTEGTAKKEENLSNVLDSIEVIKPSKIGKVNLLIENSASMFGYVNGFTEYVDVISELAEMPDFAAEQTPREFYFVNGGNDITITPIGHDPAALKGKLNVGGFNVGDPSKSNLNTMFQVALDMAKADTISIFISDGIYDIGNQDALSIEGKETRSKFIQRLGLGDLQTIMIKLHSQFDGNYFPIGGAGIKINQTRPFYIWIFGDSELLNKYFTEEYIGSLKGYKDMARFLKFDGLTIPFQATSESRLGSFKFDRNNKNILTDVELDRNGRGFQFSFATDFSELPFSDNYLENIDNYSCSNNYKIESIAKIEKKFHAVTSFKPTHLITVSNLNSPYGEMYITLKNVTPDWIATSHSDDEFNIKSDTSQTIGFKFLTDGISEAYEYRNNEKVVTQFKFELTK